MADNMKYLDLVRGSIILTTGTSDYPSDIKAFFSAATCESSDLVNIWPDMGSYEILKEFKPVGAISIPGWICWYCGSYNEEIDHRCTGCNAPERTVA